jgi:hypothetical protein
VWLEYLLGVVAAAGWGWVVFADKDVKTTKYWDKKAVQEFTKWFQKVGSISRNLELPVFRSVRKSRVFWRCKNFDKSEVVLDRQTHPAMWRTRGHSGDRAIKRLFQDKGRPPDRPLKSVQLYALSNKNMPF